MLENSPSGLVESEREGEIDCFHKSPRFVVNPAATCEPEIKAGVATNCQDCITPFQRSN